MESHYMTQRQNGSIAEVTKTLHNSNYSTLHINTGQISSGINRNEFGKWRGSYWKHRSNDFIP